MSDIVYPLPKPYKTFKFLGESYVDTLLSPGLKQIFDLLRKNNGSYVGVSEQGAKFFIDRNPILKINDSMVEDIKILLADDVKHYHDISEYRLSEDRKALILIYYTQ